MEYGFTEKEAMIYIASLELWQAPASKIARSIWENRITTYTVIKKLVDKWIMQSVQKSNSTFYSALNPTSLLEKVKNLHNKFTELLPDFLSLRSKYDNQPKVKIYEWFSWLKTLFEEISTYWKENKVGEYFTFIWSDDICDEFEKYLVTKFRKERIDNNKFKTKAILAKKDTPYIEYIKQNHQYIEIDDELFDMGNEIVLFWNNKIGILVYWENELFWVMLESNTLFKALKSMFNLLWKIYNNEKYFIE